MNLSKKDDIKDVIPVFFFKPSVEQRMQHKLLRIQNKNQRDRYCRFLYGLTGYHVILGSK